VNNTNAKFNSASLFAQEGRETVLFHAPPTLSLAHMRGLSKLRHINVYPRACLGLTPSYSRSLTQVIVTSPSHQKPGAPRISYNKPNVEFRSARYCRPHHHRSLSSSSPCHRDSESSSAPEWVSLEEPVSDYRPSGYHPVRIGDIFHSKYKVVHKLGWGAHSTVWLVQNQE
jgi:hypothetical protein